MSSCYDCLLSSMQRLTRFVIDSARRVKDESQSPDVPSLRVLRMAPCWNDLYEEERKTKKQAKWLLEKESKAKVTAELKSKLQQQLEDVMLRKDNLLREEREVCAELQKELRQVTCRKEGAIRQANLEEEELRLKEIQNKKKQKRNNKKIKRLLRREKQRVALCDGDDQHWAGEHNETKRTASKVEMSIEENEFLQCVKRGLAKMNDSGVRRQLAKMKNSAEGKHCEDQSRVCSVHNALQPHRVARIDEVWAMFSSNLSASHAGREQSSGSQ